ncbi:MAG TPA: hypothetical protein VKA44_09115, partial [Gemmatimonadota bacterium]|nr:hypothetical protein [Gemmatimonadota bacterium]
MKTRRQIVLAATLVLAATGVTLVATGGTHAPAPVAGSHDHAAMGAGAGARPVDLPPTLERRIGVTYAEAVKEVLPRTVDAVGTVTFDERRLVSLNPKVDGW